MPAAPDTEAPATGALAHMETQERRRKLAKICSRFRSRGKKREQELRALTYQKKVGQVGGKRGRG